MRRWPTAAYGMLQLACLTVAGVVALRAANDSWADGPRALAHAARRTGVPTSTLHASQRTDLSTERHRFVRVTAPGDPNFEVTVVLAGDQVVLDSTTAGAFARLVADEDVLHRLPQLGAARVAGWYGALGDPRLCRPPIIDDKHRARLASGVRGPLRLVYDFVPVDEGVGMWRECTIELDDHGAVVVRAARRESSSELAGDCSPGQAPC